MSKDIIDITDPLVYNLLAVVPEDILKIIMRYLNYKLRNGRYMRQIEIENNQNTILHGLFIKRPKKNIDHVIFRYNEDTCVAYFFGNISLTGRRL